MRLDHFRLIAAPFTPMHDDGRLKLEVVGAQARHLVATGVRGVFVGGTSGEGQSLGVEERVALADAWAGDALRPKLELFIHVGHNCQADAVRLAQHAAAIRADRLALHAPTWFKKLSIGELIDFCVPVAAAAPSLPFYLYDIPAVTGVRLSSAQFLAGAKPRIPSLAGVKFTNPDCVAAQECIQMHERAYDVLWGCDETLLAAVALGAAGAVGSTYNVAAPLYLNMLRAVEADDWPAARRLQSRAVAMVRVFERFGTLPALKWAMSIVGVDCGPPRPPLARLSAEDQRQLREAIVTAGFLAD